MTIEQIIEQARRNGIMIANSDRRSGYNEALSDVLRIAAEDKKRIWESEYKRATQGDATE